MQKQTSLLIGCHYQEALPWPSEHLAHMHSNPFSWKPEGKRPLNSPFATSFIMRWLLLATGILTSETSRKALHYSGLFFFLGIIFFSGSLYVLCFTGITMLGAVTPFGGVFFILGWVLLGVGVYKK